MKTILLIGRNGQVGHELVSALAPLGNVIALGRAELDLAQPDSIVRCIRTAQPDIIVNAAGYTSVDGAESERELAMQINGVAPGIMAEESRRLGAMLLHYSTDYVFDGTGSRPYTEDDAPNPVNVYGHSKLAGERLIAETGCNHLILRASWIYSARGTNFVLTMLRLARTKTEIRVVDDQIGSPSWARTLAHTTSELLGIATSRPFASGVYHFSAQDYVSRFEFAAKIIDTAKTLSGNTAGWASVARSTTADYPLPAARPLNVATSKEKLLQAFGISMPGWEAQLGSFMPELLQGISR